MKSVTKSPRNEFERSGWRQLKRAKKKFKYEAKRIPYVLARHYVPDYEIEVPNGLLYLEFKGYFRQEDKSKLLAVKRQHPEMDLRIVFYRKVETSIKWCEKHGFKYAIGKIPKDWLDGY